MTKGLLNYLVCLKCKNGLELKEFSVQKENQKVVDGYLKCNCGEVYPIIKGVLRVLPEELMTKLVFEKYFDYLNRYDKDLPSSFVEKWKSNIIDKLSNKTLKISTADSFGFEWKKFNKLFDIYKQNFLNYVQPFKENFFKNKVILDAGCGVGRHTYWAAKFGAKEVIGIDLSEAVDSAESNCRELSNVNIIQADIYKLPFKSIFDFIFSIGVLHHLPEPENGFRNLLNYLKEDALMLIWVYGRKNNFSNVYIYESLRIITKHINSKILYYLCYPFAIGVECINKTADLFEKVDATKKIAKLMPFQYYRQFPFEVKLNDAFDVLATPRSRYYMMDEIKDWFLRAGFKNPKLSYLRKKSIIAYDFNKNSQ